MSFEPPKMPQKGRKFAADYFDKLYTYGVRMDVLRILREKYQLSLAECQGQKPEVVQERQRQYLEHLKRLQAQWKKEDEEKYGKEEDPVAET